MTDLYPVEDLNAPYEDGTVPENDDGTMPDNVDRLRQAVVGHRIVKTERREIERKYYSTPEEVLIITLDDGTEVQLRNTDDCCAYTELKEFLLHPEKVDHVIIGIGTTELYTRWHIYADMGDVLELTVDWSCGNPFYYGYGFDIDVIHNPDTTTHIGE